MIVVQRYRIGIYGDEFHAQQPGRNHSIYRIASGAAYADHLHPRFGVKAFVKSKHDLLLL